MIKIKVTIICAGGQEFPCCSDLLDGCPDISVLARPASLNDTGAWLALGRSDILILDEALIQQDGVDAIRGLHAGYPSIRSLLIMENKNSNNNSILSALSLGIKGVIARESLPFALCRGLAAINSGEAWISRRLAAVLRDELVFMDRQAHWAGQSHGHPSRDRMN